MANHGFVTTRRILRFDRVHADLSEIVQRRFKGKMQINGPHEEDGVVMWVMQPCKESISGIVHGFQVWLSTSRKLEFRHPFNDWAFWAQVVVINELGARYNGIISDEGVSEKWKPDPKKYPTYKSWADARHARCPRWLRGVLTMADISHVPPYLRTL